MLPVSSRCPSPTGHRQVRSSIERDRTPIDSAASCIHIELRQWSKFLSVRVVNPNTCVHLQIAYVAREICFCAQNAAPAAVPAEDHAAYLSQRGFVPLRVEFDLHLIQR